MCRQSKYYSYGIEFSIICKWGDNMIYKFHYGAPLLTRDYVKAILPLIGNISEFEIYGSYDATPYIEPGKNKDKKYTFILRDNLENEIWLDTLCGYHGSGPQATIEILQILGLKDDYKITEKAYIKESNLQPVHCLNLLAATWDLPTPKKHFFAAMTFSYAHQLHATKTMLNCFGKLVNYAEGMYLEDDMLFRPYSSGNKEWADYATNNIYTYNQEFDTFSTDQLRMILENIVTRNKGRLEIQEL